MAGRAAGQTLQPTALVHEAWLRLVAKSDRTWQDRNHFFNAAAESLRQSNLAIEQLNGAARGFQNGIALFKL
jgi:hypothetical protein